MAYPTISHNAVLVGFCPLIPLPFLDEFLRKHMMKGAYLSIGEQEGQVLSDESVEVLASGRGSLLLGCLVALVWWPLRKFLKTFFYFLTVKECFDWAAEAVVRGVMVKRAVERGQVPARTESVRRAMDLAWKRHGGSPVVRYIRRKPSGVVPWGGATGPITELGAGLARWSGGAEVLAEFDELLDRVELGRPLLDGEMPRLERQDSSPAVEV